MPRQKQLSIALQRIDNKKPRLLQLSTDLSSSGLPGVQFHSVLLLLCIHVQIFDVHTVIVINACTTWGHIITHFWPMMTSVVMVLNLFLNLLQICILQDNPDLVTVDGQEGSIPVWHRRPQDGAAWEQPCFPSDLTKIPHGYNLHCFWPCCL